LDAGVLRTKALVLEQKQLARLVLDGNEVELVFDDSAARLELDDNAEQPELGDNVEPPVLDDNVEQLELNDNAAQLQHDDGDLEQPRNEHDGGDAARLLELEQTQLVSAGIVDS